MNDHLDKIRIIESRRAALERRVVENPFGRPEPPQQPAERAAILRQAGSAALAMKIVLVTIASFLFRRGRTARVRDVLHVVTIHRNQAAHPLRPQYRKSVE